MKTEFKAKFLQHINKRRQDQGFTLIELLVVIIIIGILSAIALPAFLNQANKAKQSEAKQYVASINKGQQAYYAENGKFTTVIPDLGLGLKTETTNYTYDVVSTKDDQANTNAVPTNTTSLRAYGGVVVLVDSGEAKTTQTSICEAVGGTAKFAATDCGAAWSAVTK
ncbi:type IV pilin-like G/H family protein [Microcoleus sp. A003_D6]|uniref:type IV pilin-like G/H family protein n=1 Tax=Microcoleus sp. A003_D6 TaxID=3055266 RepID=UPI002FD022DF